MLSKIASVIDNSRLEKINGNDPNMAILIQDKDVNRKACCKFNFFS